MRRFLAVLAMLCPFMSMGQSITIKGKIINEGMEPVVGATISVKGSGKITTSNSRGEFALLETNLLDTLIVSSVGYETKEVPNNERGLVTVILQRRVGVLDEAVVIAYGTTTRRLNTGSVSRVSAGEISRQPVTNPLSSLEGLVPGLFVAQSSGLPGANYTIQLRGLNSLKQGTQPLFIVDGVPFMLNSATLGQLSTLNNNIFNNINPADIESIEVLKDADATAIYGSQGANGVVLITTKKGRAGKTSFDFSYHTGFGKVTRTLPLLHSDQYLEMRREAFANDSISPTASNAPDLLAWDPSRYTNWKDLLIGGTARTNSFQASLSGGSATTRYLFSAAYATETTVFPGTQPYKRGTARFQLNHATPGDRFRFGLSASFAADKKSLPLNDLTSFIYLPPNAPALYDSAGNLAWTTGIENPMSHLLRRYDAGNNNLVSSASLRYTIFPGLVFSTSFGYNAIWNTEETALPIKAQRPSATATGTAQWASATVRNWVAEPLLEYKRTFSKTQVSLLAGSSFQQRTQDGNTVTGTRYANDDLLGTMAAAGQLSVSNYKSRYNYAAVFGRVTINRDQRYLLNLNVRRDGSSRFGPASRFASFGSVGGAWVFSTIKALRKSSVLSWGKLRSSIGVTGNDQVGDYRYLDGWSTTTAYQYAGAPAGVLPVRLFNPTYEWERVRKLELGLDLGFFRDRILLAASWYRNRSGNQLVSYKLPGQTGFNSILKNLDAVIENSGLEVELDTRNIEKGHFAWTTGLNISFPRNKLLAYPGLENSSDKFNYSIGQPLRIVYGYRYTGIDPQSGVYTFEDLNGNGTITNPADLSLLGAVEQRFFGGLTNRWTYGGFELSFLLQFVKQTGRNYLTNLAAIPGTMSNQPVFVLDRWQKEADAPLVQKFTQATTSPVYKAYNLYRSSSANLEDASYIRFRNLYVAYSLPATVLRRIKVSQFRFYVSGQNLVTWTGYQGADPETASATSLPPLRLLTTGIHLTL